MPSRLVANQRSCPVKRHYASAEEAAAMAERRAARIGEPLRAYICLACDGHVIGHPKHWRAKAREAEVRARWDVIREQRRVVSQPTTEISEMTMIGRRSTDHGTGGSEWIPMPPDSYMFEVGAGEVKLSSFKSQKGEDQYNVSFPLKLTDEEYERVKAEMGDEIGEGEELSGRTRYSCGLTLGWFSKGEYKSTRLADFLTTLLGSKQQKQLREYFIAGGGPYITPDSSVEDQISEWNSWFAWFEGCKVHGTITHRKDKVDPNKIWSDFGGPIAVGQRPGPPDPDYEAFGRGKLRMILNQSNGVTRDDPDPEAKYDSTGELLEPEPAPAAPTDTAAMLAELEELRKLKAAQNQEKVGVSDETVKELFGAAIG